MSFCIQWNLQSKKQRRKGSETRWTAVKLQILVEEHSRLPVPGSPKLSWWIVLKQHSKVIGDTMQSRPKFKHLARSSSKTKSCIFLQSSLHSWAQAAPTHELGCASSSFPFPPRCSEPLKHIQDKLHSMAWPNQHRTKPSLALADQLLQTCD